MIKTADEAAAKAKKAIASQNDEITQFNTQQVIKKVKIVGKKNWVDAVLRAPENITKQGAPEDQAAFLNRLLVLDPGNALAQKALDNLKAGRKPSPRRPSLRNRAARRSPDPASTALSWSAHDRLGFLLACTLAMSLGAQSLTDRFKEVRRPGKPSWIEVKRPPSGRASKPCSAGRDSR